MQPLEEIMNKTDNAVCRFCGTKIKHTFLDLGMSPFCQTHVKPDQLNEMEPFFPLHVNICEACLLVQLDEYMAPSNIFSDYAYFSSYSDSWVEHARQYVDMIIDKLSLSSESLVMEIASNDGYLLQHFVERKIPSRGVEPAANVAKEAIKKGIPTTIAFFGKATAQNLADQYGKVDLLLGNNVLAHVPDLNDFVKGMKVLLKPSGIITMEFPHLMRLMEENQFDTIYHEHFSYFSFFTVEKVFKAHGITLFDVEELKSHGGSIRIYGKHDDNMDIPVHERVLKLKQAEASKGYTKLDTYFSFSDKVQKTKRGILSFLNEAKENGKSIVGYGAPGKGNTLLNYCGIRQDYLDYTVDRSPHKQGLYTPGTRIPILSPEVIKTTKPDYIFILPWNLKKEIMNQMHYVSEWGCKFVVPIPELTILG